MTRHVGGYEGIGGLHPTAPVLVAETVDGRVTGFVFVVDAEGFVRYRGAPDADYEDPAQNAGWLRAALEAVLSGDAPAPAETKPVGCSIKWKP